MEINKDYKLDFMRAERKNMKLIMLMDKSKDYILNFMKAERKNMN